MGDTSRMIDCLATAHFNRPDLTQRMIASIDFPVRHLLIVNNGSDSLHELKIPGFVGEFHEIVNGENKGCSGGWNQCVDFAFNQNSCGSVLVCGNDIQWSSGDLEKFDTALQQNPDSEWLFGNWSFSTWMMTRKGHDGFGWFDENYEKAYLEDADAWRRVCLMSPKIVSVDTQAIHGEAPTWGSSTIYSDPHMKQIVEAAHSRNWGYHMKKWGGRREGNTERFTTPFDAGGPTNSWTLDEAGRNRPHFLEHA